MSDSSYSSCKGGSVSLRSWWLCRKDSKEGEIPWNTAIYGHFEIGHWVVHHGIWAFQIFRPSRSSRVSISTGQTDRKGKSIWKNSISIFPSVESRSRKSSMYKSFSFIFPMVSKIFPYFPHLSWHSSHPRCNRRTTRWRLEIDLAPWPWRARTRVGGLGVVRISDQFEGKTCYHKRFVIIKLIMIRLRNGCRWFDDLNLPCFLRSRSIWFYVFWCLRIMM